MAWCRIDTKPLTEPLPTYHKLGPQKQSSLKFESKYRGKYISLSRKCVWKCCLQYVSHFVEAIMLITVLWCKHYVSIMASTQKKKNMKINLTSSTSISHEICTHMCCALFCCGHISLLVDLFDLPIFLTHWGQDKMAAIFQTTFSNGFPWMKMHEFRLTFHWSLFLGVQLTIIQHWFR